ncbi:MAG TPA: AbrB/MazE/SpoVT family DNA-binding domain-containing protein [Terriglobales bacterium]|nr:AbrB/MazE/SpoVT family DNA-binding domain-containing protein [Terriglobales bacterium]
MSKTNRTSKKIARNLKKAVHGESIAEARVFMTGRSQAVRLPKEYRVPGDSVFVKRLGTGILLIPKTADRWTAAFAAMDEFNGSDFEVIRDQEQQKRPGLEDLFGDGDK